MNTEILGVIAQIVLMVVLAYPIGKYISKVFKGEKVWSDCRSNRRDELETIPESIARDKPLLVFLGNDIVSFSGSTAPKSRRQFRTVCSSGIQHMYQLPREL